MNKSWFLAASAWQQIFGLYSRLAIQQWSLAPDTKICAASLPNSQLLNSFVYMPKELFEATYNEPILINEKVAFCVFFALFFCLFLVYLKQVCPAKRQKNRTKNPSKINVFVY